MSSLGPEAGTTAAEYFEGSDLALQVSLYLETSHGGVMAQHGPSPLGLPCPGLFPASHTTCHVSWSHQWQWTVEVLDRGTCQCRGRVASEISGVSQSAGDTV